MQSSVAARQESQGGTPRPLTSAADRLHPIAEGNLGSESPSSAFDPMMPQDDAPQSRSLSFSPSYHKYLSNALARHTLSASAKWPYEAVVQTGAPRVRLAILMRGLASLLFYFGTILAVPLCSLGAERLSVFLGAEYEDSRLCLWIPRPKVGLGAGHGVGPHRHRYSTFYNIYIFSSSPQLS